MRSSGGLDDIKTFIYKINIFCILTNDIIPLINFA